VTPCELHPAATGCGLGAPARTRPARRLERRGLKRSIGSRDNAHPRSVNGGCAIRLDIVTPSLGGRSDARPVRFGRWDAEIVFAVDATKPARAAHLDGVLASPHTVTKAQASFSRHRLASGRLRGGIPWAPPLKRPLENRRYSPRCASTGNITSVRDSIARGPATRSAGHITQGAPTALCAATVATCPLGWHWNSVYTARRARLRLQTRFL
jgi:hypothetical protein